jgi:amino acid adenylation domain-containing protein
MAKDAGILQGGRTNLTDVSFNYIDLSTPPRFGETQAQLSFNINPCERGPVQLRLYDRGDDAESEAVLYCRSDYLSLEETEALLKRLYFILEQIAHGGLSKKCSELDFLLPDERYRLMTEWNDTAVDFPKVETVSRLFEAQARRTPDAVAAIYEGEQITYAQLNRRANRLAHCLRNKGVRPDVLVGICAERSLEMIVGLLGILKAGGAYVPLDPAYPVERLAYMLDDAGPAVLVTQRHLEAVLPARDIPTVFLDADEEALADYPDTDPDYASSSDNLAYVIYTSGSTGKPKGVAITHRAINRLVFDTRYVDLHSADVVAQAANSSFDAITFEIWGALLHGCRLCLIAREKILSPLHFAEEIERNGISVLFITTALFNQFSVLAPQAFRRMRYVLFGGEAVDAQAVENVLRHGPPENLLHVYGPTESTTFATWHRVGEACAEATTIPIGCPIANTQIYILDGNLDPVPVGVEGELFIAGEGLARGYLNRAALTAEKFIPNPFSGTPGARLYRTGDLARYLPDGHIEYVGRIDQQVKIRGFRIELGEIETVLAALPAIRDAVVLAREDTAGDKRLVAYVVAQDGAQIDEQAVRQLLMRQLPEYMVPAHFIRLDQLPLTPNGKIDRKSLPAPDLTRGQLDYVAPSSPTEIILAGIWANVLKLDKVGIHDNFFAMGGHSLLATQMMSRARQELGIDLPLRTIFEALTISTLAQRYDELLKLVSQPDANELDDGLEEVEY